MNKWRWIRLGVIFVIVYILFGSHLLGNGLFVTCYVTFVAWIVLEIVLAVLKWLDGKRKD